MISLNELINVEEKLLKFEETDKFLINFNVYIKLEKYLEEIGYITNCYFSLLKEYEEKLIKQELNYEAMSRILEGFIEQTLNTDIEYNIEEVKEFMLKNNIK